MNRARRPESRHRNRLVGVAGFFTLLAAGLGNSPAAWGLLVVTAGLVLWASTYRGDSLFITREPEKWPIGSTWRMYRITSLDRRDDDSWLVRGTPLR